MYKKFILLAFITYYVSKIKPLSAVLIHTENLTGKGYWILALHIIFLKQVDLQ